MADYKIQPNDLVISVLNVGFGDNIVIRFPCKPDNTYPVGIVDCYKAEKTKEYIKRHTENSFYIEFICATHPHKDHILGINSLLTDSDFVPKEFWDSGFRHNSNTYRMILMTLISSSTKTIRASSGMERYIGNVSITVLAPSILLRNRYATYGVDMNNASIVLRLEHHSQNVLEIKSEEYLGNMSQEDIRQAGKSVAILAGDAEFDSWSHITQEFPKLEKQSKHKPLVNKIINYLACHTIKVAHHGSMHSSPLDVYEKMSPNLAVISTEQKLSTSVVGTRNMFPHDSSILALKECNADILTTDGSYEASLSNLNQPQKGSIIIAIPPGRSPHWRKMGDDSNSPPPAPTVLDKP
jgi:beta-lactamase superfamily II metal-dependent hydrolase